MLQNVHAFAKVNRTAVHSMIRMQGSATDVTRRLVSQYMGDLSITAASSFDRILGIYMVIGTPLMRRITQLACMTSRTLIRFPGSVTEK